jgi:hypothetical protein
MGNAITKLQKTDSVPKIYIRLPFGTYSFNLGLKNCLVR